MRPDTEPSASAVAEFNAEGAACAAPEPHAFIANRIGKSRGLE